MNKIYRLVWNKYLGLWTVVSELARGTSKKRNVSADVTTISQPPISLYTKYYLPPIVLTVVLSSIFFSHNAYAGYEAGGGSTYNNCTAGVVGSGTKSGNSVAIGNGSCAAGNGGISMGSRADSSTAPNNIAMGSNAKTGNILSPTADGAPLNGGSQIAIGKNAQTSVAGSIAIGNDSKTGGQNFSVAIGGYAEATGNSAIAFGRRTEASGFGGVAVGSNAKSSGSDSTAVGSNAVASKQAATALGNQANAIERGATAVGFGANAVSVGASAVGVNAYAAGRIKNGIDWESSAFGSNSKADGAGALALGNFSTATAEETTAAGNGSKATANFATALGTLAEATAEETVSVGHMSKAQSQADVAIGSDATTEASTNGKNVAIGNKVSTGGTGQNVAIGSDGTTANSRTTDGGAVSIGRGQVATGDGAVAIGDPNVVNGDGAIALGKDNTAAGNAAGTTAANGAVAIGNTNQAIGQGSVALGNTSIAAAAGAIALGDTANAAAREAIAIGKQSTAENTQDIALGQGATAQGITENGLIRTATAIGRGANADGRNTLAVGEASAATGSAATAISSGAQATADFTTAVGSQAQATADFATALGNEAVASATGATVTGSNAIASGELSSAFGAESNAAGDQSIAIGNVANAQATRGVALGSGATATNADDVALGAGSVTSAANPTANGTVGGITYGYAGTTPSSVVSVGSEGNERQVTNVAAGRVSETSTDAINGSQLYSTQQALGNLADSTANHLGGGSTVNPDGSISEPVYALTSNPAANTVNVTNNVGDALNTLNTAVNQPLTFTGNSGSTAQQLGSTLAVEGTSTTGGGYSGSNLQTVVTQDKILIEMADNPEFTSVTAGDTVINTDGVTITNGPSITRSGINAGGNPITNVGAGVAGTDAVNKDQLDAATAAGKNTVTDGKNITVTESRNADGSTNYEVATVDDVEFNNVTVGDVNIDGSTGKISGVTAGDVNATSTDAINGSQLAGTAKSVSDALGGGSVVNPDGTVTAPSYDVNGTSVSNVGEAIEALDQGWNLQSNAAKAGAVKAGDTVDIGTVTGEENLTVTKDGNTIQYGLNKNLRVDSVRSGDTLINDNGVTITNGPSITKSGINAAGNPISNVGAGVNDSDAVNKGQLDDAAAAAKTEVTQGKNITVSKTTGADGQDIYNVATADNVEFNNVTVGDVTIDGSTGKISGVTAGDVNPTSTDAINGSQLHGVADSVRNSIGGETILNPDGTVTTSNVGNTGQNNIHDAINSVRGQAAAAKTEVEAGKNMTVESRTGADGQTIYEVATADEVDFNKVTVGGPNGVSIDGTTGKISGVAAGDVNATSTDAINGSQLAGTAKSVSDALGGGSVVNPDGMVTAPSYDVNGISVSNVGEAIEALDQGWNLQSNGPDNKGAVKAGDTVDIGTVVGEENLTVTKGGNTIQYGLNRDLKVDSVTAGDTVINTDGMTITNGPSMTKSGIDAAGNPISNVGAGVNGTDAVNKDQLEAAAAAAKTEVTQGKNINVTESTGADGQTIYEVATADDVSFDSVQVGDVNIDGSTGKISGVADGTIAAGSTEAINGGQLHGVADSVRSSIGGETVLNPNGSVTTSNVGNTGEGNIHDAIDSVRKNAVTAKTTVTEGDNIVVTESTNPDGSTNYEVATARDVDFDSVQVGDVNIDGTTGKISGVAAGDVNPTSTDVINGSQLAGTAQSVSDALGGGSVVNPDGTVTAPNYEVNGETVRNVGEAITELDKGWKLQSNEADAGAVKAGDTVDIGTVQGEENLTVSKDGNTIQYGLNKDLKVDSLTTGDTVLNSDGITIVDGPSITKSGIDAAGNKISNIADGTIAAGSKDAVNGGQLNDSVASTGDILGGGVTNEGGKLNGPFTVNDKGYDTVADAIQGEAAAAKTEVEAGKNMTVASRTGADGQTIYEVATADDVSFDSVQVGDVNIDGATGKISGVADGTVAAGSTEVINGGQLHGVTDSVRSSIGGETVLNPNGSVTTSNVGNTGEGNIHDAIDSVRKNAVTAKTTVTEGDNMVVTESTNADGSTNYEVATAKDVKFDSVTSTDAEGNETILDAKGVSLKDQDGNTTILGQDGLGFADPMGNSVGPRISARGIDAGNTLITGVAPGRITADSTDAINGSQLKGVADSVSTAIGGNTTVNPDGTIITKDIGGTGKNNINDAIGAVGKAAKEAKTTVSKADGDENVTVTSSPNSEGGTDFQVGLSKDINVDSVTAGDTVINGDGLTIAGGPSVTKEGIDAGDNKVTGVADGTVAAGSKDAINGGQLHGVADSVKNIVGGNTTINPDGTIVGDNIGGTGQDNINDAIGAVGKAAQAAKSTVSNKDGNIKVTETTKVDGSKDYEVGLAKDIQVDSVTANQVNVGGAGGTTIAADGVRIAEGPSITKGGVDAGSKKVTAVADGAIAPDSKDAINGSQLHKSYENVGKALGGGAGYDPVNGWTPPSYEVAGGKHNNVGDALNALNNADQALGDRITNLGDQMQQAFYDTNQRIDDVKKMANAGVAAAMALETAPYISGKYTYAVGAAYHGGENAVGVTLRKTADNGRWSLTTGVAAASQGDPSFRVGLSGVFD